MANVATGYYEVDPISRIEGHLGVKVQVDGAGNVAEAWAHGNLWRGFENFLLGRAANDAITFTQRICGVCPIPHATASMFACDGALGVSDGYITFKAADGKGVPEAALHIRNLIYATEFVMSNITHFYHLAAPSYVQGPPVPPWTPYFAAAQYHDLLESAGKAVPAQEETNLDAGGPFDTYFGEGFFPTDIWSAVIKSYVKALKIRRLTFEAGALFAGRMPMTSSFVAGGVTNTWASKADFDTKCDTYRNLYKEIGDFVVKEYIPIALALSYFYPGYDNAANTGGLGYGAGCMNLLSWGAFPQTDDTVAIQGGYKVYGGASDVFMTGKSDLADAKALVLANLKEDISRARYQDIGAVDPSGVVYPRTIINEFDASGQAYPGAVTRTVPDRDKGDGYTWMKAPRFNGYPMEVGPFARMVLNGKYPDDGTAIVSGAYATLYGGVAPASIKLQVLSKDLAYALVKAGVATTDGVSVTGPIVDHILGLKGGYSTMDRLRGRAIESFWLVAWQIGAPSFNGTTGELEWVGTGWIDSLKALWTGADAPTTYIDYAPPSVTTSSLGVSEAPRGCLAHFVTADTRQRITAYQCVVPTTWNGSPKDGPDATVGSSAGATPALRAAANNAAVTKRGPMEMAMLGLPYEDAPIDGRNSGVEVMRVAQSFDPCIACSIH